MTTKPPASVRDGVWPKCPPPLTQDQRRLQQEFLRIWHEHLPRRYRRIERFNHASRVIAGSSFSGCRTLEIGAGLGAHLEYENLAEQDYSVLEVRADFIATIARRFPTITAIHGDIQERTECLADASFDRILAIHVLEHLRDLPRALAEIRRLLTPGGTFVAVIPCEGGLAYRVARRLSAQRLFEKTFGTSYEPIIRNEHVSRASEILAEISRGFEVVRREFWPFRAPVIQPNLAIALACTRPPR